MSGLKVGETRTLHLTLAARDLAYWDDAAHRFIVEPGKERILVGASSSDIRLRSTIELSGNRAFAPDLQQEIPFD